MRKIHLKFPGKISNKWNVDKLYSAKDCVKFDVVFDQIADGKEEKANKNWIFLLKMLCNGHILEKRRREDDSFMFTYVNLILSVAHNEE